MHSNQVSTPPVSLRLGIKINPLEIVSGTLISYFLRQLINKMRSTGSFHLEAHRTDEHVLNLKYSEIPEEYQNQFIQILPQNRQDLEFLVEKNIEIVIDLQSHIIETPRETPFKDDKVRYDIVPTANIDSIEFVETLPDEKNFKPNSLTIVPLKRSHISNNQNLSTPQQYLWRIFYTDNRGNTKILSTFLAKKELITDLSDSEKTSWSQYLKNALIPTLGMTRKTHVFKSVGRLVPDNIGTLSVKNKNRAIRKLVIGENEEPERLGEIIKNEKKLANKAGFHYKTPVYDQNENVFYMAMELINGETLDNFIKTNKNINIDIKINILIELGWKLAKLHDLNIIHGDVKPENIMVEKCFDETQMSVTPFDFDLSVDAANIVPRKIGTLLYMAPEVIDSKEISKEIDTFSYGIVVCEMMEIDYFERAKKTKSDVKKQLEAFEYARTYSDIPFTPEDFSKTGLTADHQELFKKVILQLTNLNPKERNLKDAISTLEKIKLERMLEKNEKNKEQIKKAHDAAIELRKTHDVIKFQNQVPSALAKFNDSKEALAEFISMARIEAIKDCKTKKDIQTKIDSIINEYISLSSKLLSLQNLYKNFAADHYSNEICALLNKIEVIKKYCDIAVNKQSRYPLTIDNFVIINRKMKKDIATLEKKYSDFKSTHSYKILETKESYRKQLTQSYIKVIERIDSKIETDAKLQKHLKSTIDVCFHKSQSSDHEDNTRPNFLLIIMGKIFEFELKNNTVTRHNNNLNFISATIDKILGLAANQSQINPGKEEESPSISKQTKLTISSENNELSKFKNALKTAIAKYLAATVGESVKTDKRAFSERRQKNINKLLNIINEADNEATLYTQVKNIVDIEICGGGALNLTGFFSRSTLRKLLNKVLDQYQPMVASLRHQVRDFKN